MVHAQFVDGELIPLTQKDADELKEMFPDGNVILTSDNCPELAEVINRILAKLLEQNREAYGALARND